jgi:cell division protein FtsL
MACFAIAGILYLAQASQSSVLEYNISVLQSQQAQLDGQNATLRATATQLQSLQRIDAIATQQLHMARPDLRTAIWINPVLLRAATVHSTHADLVAAERASQPLAWMKRFLRLVRASL